MISDYSENAQVALMLTGSPIDSRGDSNYFLTSSEWKELTKCLSEKGLCLKDLPGKNLDDLKNILQGSPLDPEKIHQLLRKGTALSLFLEEISQLGIWILTRFDKKYPKVLIDKLEDKSPLIIFGVGDMSLLSTSCGQDTQSMADQSGEHPSDVIGKIESRSLANYSYDNIPTVVVTEDSLMDMATRGLIRQKLMDNEVALLSLFSPSKTLSFEPFCSTEEFINALTTKEKGSEELDADEPAIDRDGQLSFFSLSTSNLWRNKEEILNKIDDVEADKFVKLFLRELISRDLLTRNHREIVRQFKEEFEDIRVKQIENWLKSCVRLNLLEKRSEKNRIRYELGSTILK